MKDRNNNTLDADFSGIAVTCSMLSTCFSSPEIQIKLTTRILLFLYSAILKGGKGDIKRTQLYDSATVEVAVVEEVDGKAAVEKKEPEASAVDSTKKVPESSASKAADSSKKVTESPALKTK